MVKVFPFKGSIGEIVPPKVESKPRKKYVVKHVYINAMDHSVLECIVTEAKMRGISQSALIVKTLREFYGLPKICFKCGQVKKA